MDMSSVIIAKSDQINADDLVGCPRTVTISGVKINAGDEQPVAVNIEGDKKVFRPCKTVSRILVGLWGPDASAYIGKSLTLCRDPDVTWGGVKVGGIRVSHASHIDGMRKITVKESQKKYKTFEIRPLGAVETAPDAARDWADGFTGAVDNQMDIEALDALVGRNAKRLSALEDDRHELAKQCQDAIERRRAELSDTGPARTDADHGDQHDGTDEDELAARAREHSNAQAAEVPEEF